MKKILILAANPNNTGQLCLDKEVREIDEGLQRSRHRDQFELVSKWAVRSRDFYRYMLDIQPHIIHFSGHGGGEHGIVLEDEENKAQFLPNEQLAAMFKLFADKGLECVMLNACYSEVQAEVVSQHVNYVIGMNKAIGDKAAINFAVAFYDALGAGETIKFAFDLACTQIIGLKEHETPQLLSKGLQNVNVNLPLALKSTAVIQGSEQKSQGQQRSLAGLPPTNSKISKRVPLISIAVVGLCICLAGVGINQLLNTRSPEKGNLITAPENPSRPKGSYIKYEGNPEADFFPEPTLLKGHQDKIQSASFSPDGENIVTTSDDNTTRIWNLDGQERQLFQHGKEAYSPWAARFSPDGKHVVISLKNLTIQIWNLTAEKVATIKGGPLHAKTFNRDKFSPDGELFITNRTSTVAIWDFKGQRKAAFKALDTPRRFIFSPDGKHVATVTAFPHIVQIWNLMGDEVVRLEGHQGLIDWVNFSPDGQRIITVSQDGTARIWSLDAKELMSLEVDNPKMASFSSNGKRIITGGETDIGNEIVLWDSTTGRSIYTIDLLQNNRFNHVFFSPNGQCVVTDSYPDDPEFSADSYIRFWNLEGGEEIGRFKYSDAGSFAAIDFSSDNVRILTISETISALWTLKGPAQCLG